MTPTKVILQIVYSEEEISDELKEYKKELERYMLNSQYFVVHFNAYVLGSSSIGTCRIILYRQAQLKKSKQIFKIRHVQIDELPRTLV